MHNHPRGFVDDDEVRVLKEDVERNVFGGRFRGNRLRQGDGNHVSIAYRRVRLYDFHAWKRNVAFLDQALNLRA
jgi:hypothetical protein